MKRLVLFVCIFVFNLHVHAQDAGVVSRGYILPNTEERELTSKITNRNYHLLVHLPDGYDRSEAVDYPVFYILDGQWDFSVAVGIYGKLNYDKELPKVIIVGIAWDDEDQKSGARRRDLVNMGGVQASGAERFLQVLEKEIVPWVESTYKTRGERLIAGSSMSASFVIYSMLEKPGLFNNYISNSPNYIYSFGIGEKTLTEKLNYFSTNSRYEGIYLYMACEASGECLDRANPIITYLSEKNLPGLASDIGTFEEFGHATIGLIGSLHGFKKVGSRLAPVLRAE